MQESKGALVPSLGASVAEFRASRCPRPRISTAWPTSSTGTLSQKTRGGPTSRIGRAGSPSANATGSIRFRPIRRCAPLSDAIGRGRRAQGREAQAEVGAAALGRNRRRAPRGRARVRHAASDPQADHEWNSPHLRRARRRGRGRCARKTSPRSARRSVSICARSGTRRSFCSDSRAASAALKSSRSMSAILSSKTACCA